MHKFPLAVSTKNKAPEGMRETVETKVSDYGRSISLNIDTLCERTADEPDM